MHTFDLYLFIILLNVMLVNVNDTANVRQETIKGIIK